MIATAKSTSLGQSVGFPTPTHNPRSRRGNALSKVPRKNRHPVRAATDSFDVLSQCDSAPAKSGNRRGPSTLQTMSGECERRLSCAGNVSQQRARTCSQSATRRLTCCRRSRANPSGRSTSQGPNSSDRAFAKRRGEPMALVTTCFGHPRGNAASVLTKDERSVSAATHSSVNSSASIRCTGAPSPK